MISPEEMVGRIGERFGVLATGPRAGGGEDDSPLPVLGRLGEVEVGGLLEQHGIERLIVSEADAGKATTVELLHRCRDLSEGQPDPQPRRSDRPLGRGG